MICTVDSYLNDETGEVTAQVYSVNGLYVNIEEFAKKMYPKEIFEDEDCCCCDECTLDCDCDDETIEDIIVRYIEEIQDNDCLCDSCLREILWNFYNKIERKILDEVLDEDDCN